MRTIVYLRVSTEDQVERYGLPSQRRACHDYAKTHGLEIVEEIADEGISGATMERPGLERLRRLVREGQADAVLMLDVDRLSRELAHLLILKPEIEKRARLEFAAAAKFEDSPSGRMFFGIRGVIAQYERELTRERTQRGRNERARDGLIVGGRSPYGYLYAGGKLIPDESQAATVRQIFEWAAAGVSMREITRRLRASEAPTWAGGNWGDTSVARILENETYAGIAHYGTHKREGKRIVLRRGERIALQVPAIVDRDLWERAQLRDRGMNTGRPTSRYLLRGLLQCGCGRRMDGNTKGSSSSYRCSGRDTLLPAGERCRTSVTTRRIDPAVWSAVIGAYCDPDRLRSAIAAHAEALRGSRVEADRVRAHLRKIQGQEQNALRAMMDSDLADGFDLFKRRYTQARAERLQVEAELARVEVPQSVDAVSVEALAERIREWVPRFEGELRGELLRRLVRRVQWDGAMARIECGFRLDGGNRAERVDDRCDIAPPTVPTISFVIAGVAA